MYPLAPLDDQHDLAVAESMVHLVGPTYVSEDGQTLGLVIEQDRVVRGDEPAVVAADQDAPGVLADQPPDDLGVVREMVRIVPHTVILPTPAVPRPAPHSGSLDWRSIPRALGAASPVLVAIATIFTQCPDSTDTPNGGSR